MKGLTLLLLMMSATAAAQELKNVAECRAYREAWFTSMDRDKQQLPVGELVSRAQKMATCVIDIEKEPFKPGMTYEEAVKVAMGGMDYKTVILAYYQEAFERASVFLNDKKLMTAFVADDAKRHTITK